MFSCTGNNFITILLCTNLKCGTWFSALTIWVKRCFWSGKGGFMDSGTGAFPGDPGRRGGWLTVPLVLCLPVDGRIGQMCRNYSFTAGRIPFGCLSVFTQLKKSGFSPAAFVTQIICWAKTPQLATCTSPQRTNPPPQGPLFIQTQAE